MSNGGMHLEPDRMILQQLVQKVEGAFSDLQKKTVVYVDYPLYSNIGDLLIYEGALELLARLGCKIESQYCVHNYQILLNRDIPHDWVIVLQGGGNFGDIYSCHQRLRNDVINTFRDNPIIMMPQSVHFNDPERFKQESAGYKSHKNLKLYVRDQESLKFLRSYLHKHQVFLAPDMASMLIGRWRWNNSGLGTLYLRRIDREKSTDAEDIPASFDWGDLFTPFRRKLCWNILKFARFEGKQHRLLGAGWIWRQYIRLIFRDAYRVFTSYQAVDADRLHGVIFALLLGKPVNAGDNMYGKISRYSSAWFRELKIKIR